MKKIILVFAVSFLYSNLAFSEVTMSTSSVGKLQVVTIKRDGKISQLSVNTNSSKDPLARYVNFSADGLVNVTGNITKFNGSAGVVMQSYVIIPFSNEPPKLLSQDENETVIQGSSGLKWRLNSKTTEIVSVEGCEIQTGKIKRVTLEDPANLKILSCKGKLVVDYGSRAGKGVRLNMNKNATITDSSGKSCSVPFSMLHKVVPGDEIQNNFKNHEQFLGIIKNLCAGINLKVDPVVIASPAAKGPSGKDEDAFEAQIRRLQEEATREAQPAPAQKKSGGAR